MLFSPYMYIILYILILLFQFSSLLVIIIIISFLTTLMPTPPFSISCIFSFPSFSSLTVMRYYSLSISVSLLFSVSSISLFHLSLFSLFSIISPSPSLSPQPHFKAFQVCFFFLPQCPSLCLSYKSDP
uniref:Uncharacterized protein n=1 Tax=Cacopsylla melanoneura TaxID=428564 RepID=A0A8D8RDQ3_9HEMI